MRVIGIVLALVISVGAAPVSAQRFGPEPDPATQRELLALREAAWRTWFANDRAGFERIVPEELVALGWDGGPWDDRAGTVAQMQEFAKSGRKLTALEFPRNVFQRYGDVVILYTSFRIVLSDTRRSWRRRPRDAGRRCSCAGTDGGSTRAGTSTRSAADAEPRSRNGPGCDQRASEPGSRRSKAFDSLAAWGIASQPSESAASSAHKANSTRKRPTR